MWYIREIPSNKNVGKVIFIIGRPASGKSTFAKFFTKALKRFGYLYIDDYTLLKERVKLLKDNQVKWGKNGQFEIIDRNIFDDLLDEIQQTVVRQRRRRPIVVVEFSRSNYVDSFKVLNLLTVNNYAIIYLKTPLGTCIDRNLMRAPDSPVDSVPCSVITKHYRNDDIRSLLKEHPGRVRIIENGTKSLSDLEKEAILVANEFFHIDDSPMNSNVRELTKEIAVSVLLILYLFIFSLLTVFAWKSTLSSYLGLIADNDTQLTFVKSIVYAMCAGGLGSTTYCIRSFYSNSIKGIFDFDRFKWWYFFRPLVGTILALAVYVVIKGGIGALGTGFDTTGPISNLTLFGVSYLAGFGTEQVVEWLIRASKSIFGESRVQPQQSSQDEGSKENHKTV